MAAKARMEMVVAASRAIAGSIADKLLAFDQIAANMATLAINGWDTAQKCKAGCWLADARGKHPAEFMENHYVMVVKGRLTIEPKWESMLRDMKESVPGFRFKVEREEDDGATVWMTDGVDEHRVTYTVEDARRQGLMGRDNAWSSGSTREMCLKQAIKRCVRRLGVNRAGPLPWVDVEGAELDQIDPRPPSSAEVIDEAIAGAEKPALKPEPEPVGDARARLSEEIIRRYGKIGKEKALEKVSFLYNEMMKAETGVDPGQRFAKALDIGPLDAERIIKFLGSHEEKVAARGTATEGAGGTDSKEAAGGTEPAPGREPGGEPEDDGPPALESTPAPAAAPAPKPAKASSGYDDFMLEVIRARKLFGRQFVQEAPKGSGRLWYTDQDTLEMVGRDSAVPIHREGRVTVDEIFLAQLHKVLKDYCDKKERGAR